MYSEAPSEWRIFRDVVLRCSDEIVKNLQISGALFPWLIVPMFRYLTPDQLKSMMSELRTEGERSRTLLNYLRAEHCDRISFRKFVASLCVEEKHEGHRDIVRFLEDEIPLADWKEIQGMVVEGHSPQRAYSSTNIKELLLSLSYEICEYLSIQALFPHLCIPEHSFLTDCELKYLSQLPDTNATQELLLILDREQQSSFYKFVACLFSEREHIGHREIAGYLIEAIQNSAESSLYKFVACLFSERELSGHREIAECLIETIQATGKMTRRLLVHIELKGDIVGNEFAKIDKKFWMTFENKEYDELIKQTREIRLDSTTPTDVIDRKIVASCFEAVALVHQGKVSGSFQIAITQLLLPALELCRKSENDLILQGRVCQRIAQIYLQSNQPDRAEHYFGIAKWYLFFAGRGFDKFKMLCREAKLLAVSAPEKRKEIEGLFDAALDNISGDEPYAKTCTESVLLSKAALCLNISFGTTRNSSIPNQVSPDDVAKAKNILSIIEKGGLEGMNDMRECEFNLLTAELLRLEGNVERSVTVFHKLINHKTKKLNPNIVEIAKHHCHILKST